MIKILIVGQTPPPYGGQAIMIENIIKAKYDDIAIYHVRMAFSINMQQAGIFSFKKFIHLFQIIVKIIYKKFKYNIKIMYYPPGGKNSIPIFRDIIILILTRPFFKDIIFHFHAGGLSELYNKLPILLKYFYRIAYFYPTVTIRLSELNPEDGKFLKTKYDMIIPYGIEDNYLRINIEKERSNKVKLLYVGVLCETKGIMVLLESLNNLVKTKNNIQLYLVGEFDSLEFENKVKNLIIARNLPVILTGVLTGLDKDRIYFNSDIFCFPSFFEAETFGIVLLEAMQFKLPVITTNWRGIPSVVHDNENGFLVPINNIDEFTKKLNVLIEDSQLRLEMGSKGRERYLKEFTLKKFKKNIDDMFKSLIK